MLEQYAQSVRYTEECLIEQLHEQPKKKLHIGATKSIGKYILLPNIRHFLSKPENQIELIVDNTNHLVTCSHHLNHRF